jgi:hypothetical protein
VEQGVIQVAVGVPGGQPRRQKITSRMAFQVQAIRVPNPSCFSGVK